MGPVLFMLLSESPDVVRTGTQVQLCGLPV